MFHLHLLCRLTQILFTKNLASLERDVCSRANEDSRLDKLLKSALDLFRRGSGEMGRRMKKDKCVTTLYCSV